jgi:hypothetical protein
VEPRAHPTQAVLTVAIFALAIRHGEGGLAWIEMALVAVAFGGIVGWLLASEPVIAVLCVIVADLIAAAMMTPKAYRDPHSETLAMYTLASIGGALAAGGVGALDISLLLYPVYYCVANAAMALLIFQWRR